MKIREGFILREVAGVFAAVPVEGESRQFHGMIQLNEDRSISVEKFWKKECTQEQLVKALMEEYDVEEKQDKKGYCSCSGKISGSRNFRRVGNVKMPFY